MAKKVNKKAKKLKVLIVLIMIVLILLLVAFILVRKELESRKKEVIIERLKSGIANLNYTTEDSGYKIQVLGKKEKYTTPEKIYYYDYDKKETKELYLNSNFMQEYENNGLEDLSYYKNYIEYYFIGDYYDYKYVGKEDYKGKKCTVVSLSTYNLGRVEEPEDNIIYIDDDTNLIVKIENYNIKDERKKVTEVDYDFSSGSNTLQDITPTSQELSEYSSDTNG